MKAFEPYQVKCHECQKHLGWSWVIVYGQVVCDACIDNEQTRTTGELDIGTEVGTEACLSAEDNTST